MSAERWLSQQEAIDTICRVIGGSIGRAHAVLKEARASGEIRAEPMFVLTDDGIVGFSSRPGAGPPGIWQKNSTGAEPSISEDDLLDWLNREYGPPKKKTPTGGAKRARARRAIEALWPGDPPGPDELTTKALCKRVRDWLKEQHLPSEDLDNKTIARAAERAK